MPGLLDFSTPDVPAVTPLNSGAESVLINGLAQSQKPSGDFSNQLNANINAGNSMQPNASQAQRTAASQGMPQDTYGAIRQMYNNQAQRQIKTIVDQNDLRGVQMKADYENMVSKAALGQQQMQNEQFDLFTQAQNAQEAAKAGFINSLFQLGTTAASIAALSPRGGGGRNAVGGQAAQNSAMASGAFGGDTGYVGQGSLGSFNF